MVDEEEYSLLVKCATAVKMMREVMKLVEELTDE